MKRNLEASIGVYMSHKYTHDGDHTLVYHNVDATKVINMLGFITWIDGTNKFDSSIL